MPAIYTRTGDAGDTGLFGGSRVAKDSLRVEAYGAVDEANAAIGHAKAALPDGEWRDRLHAVQLRLFTAAAELASDDTGAARLAEPIGDADVLELERLIDDCLAITGPQRAFVVPGRDDRSSRFHVARTVVRRAERRTLTLAAHESVRAVVIKYLNRLSDAVYAMARLTETWADAERIEHIVRAAVARVVGPDQPPTAEEGPDEALLRARTLTVAAQARAAQLGVPVAVAVVDDAARLVSFERMEGTLEASSQIAMDKAWTAAAFKTDTRSLGEAERTSLPGVGHTNSGRAVLFGGGFPLFSRGRCIGAVGVSGGTADEDCDIAGHALASTGFNPRTGVEE